MPNAINRAKYDQPLQKVVSSVMFAGSQHHIESLLMIKPVIIDLLNNSVKVILMGNKQWLLPMFGEHPCLSIMDWLPFELYHKMPSMATVFLTPLPDNKFSRCKSENKVLEAAAWAVPCISSDVSPFIRFNQISKGGNIVVKKERPKEWLKCIYGLLENKELYDLCSFKSYICVKDVYSLEVVNKKRVEWWKKILTIKN
jgi:hypothetical protein